MSFTAEELFGSDNEGFSDEENFSAQGKDVFRKLSSQPSNISKSNFNPNNKTPKDSWKSKNSNITTNSSQNDEGIREIYSGIKITNPIVSSDELRMLMQGRKMIKLSSLKANINKKTNDVDDDWVTIGILVNKMTKVSKNGNEYSLWKLSDLKSDKMVSLFLFGKVNEKHWKMSVGAVVGLLNATIMSDNNKGGKEFKKNATEICSLTIDDPEKLLHIGTSKDMGYCKALKKNGDVCGSLIAKSEDEFCLYHIKSAYRKFSSKRAELQSSYSNKEPEDLYFGNNYTPNVSLNEKNIVLEMKTVNKTQLASKKDTETKNLKKIIANPLSKAAQNLAAFSSGKTTVKFSSAAAETAPIAAKDIFAKLKEHNPHLNQSSSKAEKLPALAKGYKRGQMIDLPYSLKDTMMSASKRRAIEILKNKPSPVPKIVQSPPGTTASKPQTLTNSNKSKKISEILKRVNNNLNESNEELKKEQEATNKAKSKLLEDALKRKSVNQKVVQVIECEEQGKYFNKLEKKEKYENRLAEIKEFSAKVVSCSICNYTASSQSDYCKSLNHSVKFHQSTKRFFSCKKCKTRTFSFDSMLPTKACKTCGSTSYEKAAMINVRTETKLGDDLQIRGEEIQFLNSVK